MKILVMEDEIKLADYLKKGLEQSGHVVDLSHNGSTGLEMAYLNNYDLLILDLMLPGQNGFEILKNLQDFSISTPVIVLSALSDSENIIKSLDNGALDYIKKPFVFDELLARIRIIQRKALSIQQPLLKVDDLEINLVSREIKRDNRNIILSNREFALLELFMTNVNKVVTKQLIAEKVWEVDFDMGSNVIEVTVYQLRKKINKGFSKQLIQTVVNVGYILKSENK